MPARTETSRSVACRRGQLESLLNEGDQRQRVAIRIIGPEPWAPGVHVIGFVVAEGCPRSGPGKEQTYDRTTAAAACTTQSPTHGLPQIHAGQSRQCPQPLATGVQRPAPRKTRAVASPTARRIVASGRSPGDIARHSRRRSRSCMREAPEIFAAAVSISTGQFATDRGRRGGMARLDGPRSD